MTLTIDRIEEARLTPDLEAQISTLLNRAFDTDFGPYSYFQQRHHVRLIAWVDGALVGHMALGLRAVRLGDRFLDTAALAEVATDPAHQGKGIATRLMDVMLAEARAMPADIVMLFGNRPIYAAHGFVPKSNPTTSLDLTDRRINGTKSGPPSGLMVLPLTDTPWDDTAPLDLMGNKF